MLFNVASALVGAVVGLISVTIFAVVLRRISDKQPSAAIKALIKLMSIVLLGGIANRGIAEYAVYSKILSSDEALAYYLVGFSVVFLVLGSLVLISWLRSSRH